VWEGPAGPCCGGLGDAGDPYAPVVGGRGRPRSGRPQAPLDRRHFSTCVWKAALVAAEVEPSRANGMHALRHFYAPVVLDAGESIKAVAEYLGHSDPGFTPRTYSHLLPTSEQRTRQAVDRALRGGAGKVDGLTTA
jgi:integrase